MLLLKMAPKYLKCCLTFLSARRLGLVLQRKTHVLDKLCSGTSYSTVGHGVNVNETTVYNTYHLSTETHIKQDYGLIG